MKIHCIAVRTPSGAGMPANWSATEDGSSHQLPTRPSGRAGQVSLAQ